MGGDDHHPRSARLFARVVLALAFAAGVLTGALRQAAVAKDPLPPVGAVLDRAVAAARAETQHPYVSFRLHKRLVVSDAYSQDVAYRVVERTSDRLARFEDLATGAVRVGPPEPRRPDMPPALWGADARDVDAATAYAAAPTLLDAVHYDAKLLGIETAAGAPAYRILLLPHDGGLHDVLRSVLVDVKTGRVVQVITRRVVPLRVTVAGKVRDVDVPAEVTIDYAFIDNASVLTRLQLNGSAQGRTANFLYELTDIAFPRAVPATAFDPETPARATAQAGEGAVPEPLPSLSPLAGTGVTVIALGDSQTVGIGTSACRAGCRTSRTQAGSGLEVPGAMQQFALAVRAAGARLTFVPLGVAGAKTGAAPKPEAQGGDLLRNPAQVGALGTAVAAARARGDEVIVTLWSGGDDVTDAFAAGECTARGGSVAGALVGRSACASSGTTLAGALGDVQSGSFYRGYLGVMRAIAQTGPDLLVALNLTDLSRLPSSAISSEGERRRLAHDVDLANEAILAAVRDSTFARSVLVDVDAYANGRPELFAAPYVAGDGRHFSEMGYRAIAGAVVQAVAPRLAAPPR